MTANQQPALTIPLPLRPLHPSVRPQDDAVRTDPAWEREARGAAQRLADDVEARFQGLFGKARRDAPSRLSPHTPT